MKKLAETLPWFTPFNFRAWLAGHKRTDVVGYQRAHCLCPIACWCKERTGRYVRADYGQIEIDDRMFELPEWCTEFMRAFDHAGPKHEDTQIGPRRAIRILDQVLAEQRAHEELFA